jgi:hypothetical protein
LVSIQSTIFHDKYSCEESRLVLAASLGYFNVRNMRGRIKSHRQAWTRQRRTSQREDSPSTHISSHVFLHSYPMPSWIPCFLAAYCLWGCEADGYRDGDLCGDGCRRGDGYTHKDSESLNENLLHGRSAYLSRPSRLVIPSPCAPLPVPQWTPALLSGSGTGMPAWWLIRFRCSFQGRFVLGRRRDGGFILRLIHIMSRPLAPPSRLMTKPFPPPSARAE